MKGRISLLVIVVLSMVTSLSAQSIDDQIAKAEQDITAVESRLAPKLVPLLVPDADIRIWLSPTVPPLVASTFDALPSAQRHVHFDAISESGQLKNSNGGGVGCGWYVTLEGGNSAHADLDLSNLTATASSSGGVDSSVDFKAAFNAQIHGHVKGPPGPCSVWNPWPSCNCQIGGGTGTSVGVSGERSDTVKVSVLPKADSTSWLAYNVNLTSPQEIPITISVGLQGIGQVGIPISVKLPLGTLMTGSAPSVFNTSGVVNIPNILSRQYGIAIQPRPFVGDSSGYSVTATAQIEWK